MDKFNNYADSLKKEFPFRVDIDSRAESINKKVRDSQLDKIPVMVIIGEKEVKNNGEVCPERSEKNASVK